MNRIKTASVCVFLLIGWLAAPAGAADFWDITIADFAGIEPCEISLAILPSGNPAISYWDDTNNALKYAWYDGSGWRTTTVESGRDLGNYGGKASLAILPSGNPAISYWDDTNNALKYAWYDGSTWRTTTVESDCDLGNYGGKTGLAILPSGQPAISYCDDTNKALKYAWYDGSAWQTEIVDSEGEVGWDSSLAILPSGDPAISYYEYINDDLKYKYAWYDGSAWQTTTVDSPGSYGGQSSLAILPSGDPAIGYYDYANGDLKYAWYDGSAWQNTTVDSELGSWEVRPSLIILPSGQPAISYRDDTNGNLKYAWYDGSAWQTMIVYATEWVDENSNMAILLSGDPAISYYDYANGDLKFAWYDGSAWQATVIDKMGHTLGAVYPSLAILPSGEPAISYIHSLGWWWTDGDALKYAWYDGNAWQTTMVDSSGSYGSDYGQTSLAILPSGHPAISYYDSTNEDLKFACYDGSVWQTEMVDSDGDVGMYSSLAILPSGDPAISYYDDINHALKYAWYEGNAWQQTTVASGLGSNGGSHTSLAILPSGQPAISYCDDTNNALKYAWYDGSAWQTEMVDSDGDVGMYSSLAILPSGNPAISYYDSTNEDLKFAWYDSSAWQTEIVDSEGDVGGDSSLAILPSGHPAISYRSYRDYPEYTDLKYAWHDGSAWQTMIIVDSEGWAGSLAVFPSGHAAISYCSNDGLNFARIPDIAPAPVPILTSYTATAWTELGGDTVVIHGPASNKGWGSGDNPQAWAESSVSLNTTAGGHLRGRVALAGEDGYEYLGEACLEFDPDTWDCLEWVLMEEHYSCGDGSGTVAGTLDLGTSGDYPVGSGLELSLGIRLNGDPSDNEGYHLQLWRNSMLLAQIDPVAPEDVVVAVVAGETLTFELFAQEEDNYGYEGYDRSFEFRFILREPPPPVEGGGDLVVTAVGVQGTPVTGQPLHVAWDVLNADSDNTVGGGFVDALYLSKDEQWDVGDTLLATVRHGEPVAPQESYYAEADILLPGVLPGDYRILARTDWDNRVDEADGEDNNVTASDPISVDVEEFIVGTAIEDDFTELERVRYYKITISEGEVVEIHLDDLDDTGGNALYVSFNAIPAPGAYNRGSVSLSPDQTVIVQGIQAGTYYILAYASDLATSDPSPFSISTNYLPHLTLGTPATSEFSSSDRARYFGVTVAEDKDLEIHLDDLDDSGANELYVSFETAPTRSSYDYRYRTNFAPDQTVIIPSTHAGTYYILAYASDVPGSESSAFSIKAEYLPLEIISIKPDRCGNASTICPTVTIKGARFREGTTVLLRHEGEADIVPSDITFVDSGTIFVEFDLMGAAAGTWSLVVINPDSETASLPFTVVEGGNPKFETRLILPSALGFHIRSTLWIEYTNTGDGPMPVPLLKLHGSQDALLTADKSLDGHGLWTSNPPPGLTDTVQVLAVGTGPDPGVLNPGDSGRIPVYYRGLKLPWDFSYPPIEFSLGVLTADDTTAIDWIEVEAEVRPDDIAPDLWNVIWPQLKAQIGTTWADYLQVLIENARYLARNGKRTYHVRELFALEVPKATGAFLPPRTLASEVDAYCSAPGLSLVFARAVADALAQRFQVGPLGRGWSHNFEYALKRPDDFTAIVEGPGRSGRSFTKVGRLWKAAPGDYGVLKIMADGTYELQEKDGLTWLFDSNGRLVGIREPNGNQITLVYEADNLTEVRHSNGQSFTLAYNAEDRIALLTDHAGRQTQYVYDGTGEHLLSVIAPGNRATAYEYNPVSGGPGDHALTSVTFPDGTHLYYAYDALGQLTEMSRDGGTERIVFSYEGFETVHVRDKTNAETTLHYGLPRQLLAVANPLGNSVSFQYGEDFSFAGITGPDGGTYAPTYDNHGNMTEIKNPLGHTVSMYYTTDYYRLAGLIDQNGNRTAFATDDRGNLGGIIYPDFSTETLGYDDVGNVVSYTNRRGQTITYTYNDLGRLVRKEYPDGRFVTYTYDGVGRLTEVTDASGTIILQYDGRGFQERIEYPDGHWFSFAYNDAGRRTQRVSDDGYMLNYHYDATGRMERLTDGTDAEIIRYEYDEIGRLIRETKGNGAYTSYEYDAAGQVLSLVNYSPNDAVQSRFDYTYDENGNRTSMTTLEGTTVYDYDAIGQLVGVTYPDGRHVTYEYDPAGNRVTIADNGTGTAYVTNNMNQYTQVGNATHTYDADGNMTSKTDAEGTTMYGYDEENRLVLVVTPSDGTWEYTYDALGNRIAVTHDGVVTRYVHDPIGLADVAAEYDHTGALAARYIHGYGLVARIDKAAGNPAYYAFDAIGHTRQLTDSAGAVVNTYDYSPFGIPVETNELIPNPFQYVGRYGVMAEENGLCFMRARFYDSQIGRFDSTDPLQVIGTNTYDYAANAPTSYVDPTGLWWNPFRWFSDKFDEWQATMSDALHSPEYSINWAEPSTYKRGPLTMAGVEEINKWQMSNARDLAVKRLEAIALLGSVVNTGVPGPKGGVFVTATGVIATTAVQDTIECPLSQRGSDSTSSSFSGNAPDVPTQPASKGSSGSVGSYDPNEKIGPGGFGSDGFIVPDQSMVYTIYFENESDATAAAKKVKIVDQLDPDLDWTTFELLEIGFGRHQVIIPSGMTHYETSLEIDGWTFNEQDGWHTGETPLIANVKADIDIATGQVTWNIVSYDPETGWEPEDAYAGFLPPDDPDDLTHRGEGYVTFLIRPKADLPTGAQITNNASIIFDVNPPIETPYTLNTIDDGAPSSHVLPLPVSTTDTAITVKWTGEDDEGGSGIATYDVYLSVDGGSFDLWQSTADTSAVLDGQIGHTYAFYSVATDNVGHREAPPDEADTTVLIESAAIPGDLDSDGDVDRDDLNIILAHRNQSASVCPDCDLDGDGMITALDARKLVLLCTRPRCACE